VSGQLGLFSWIALKWTLLNLSQSIRNFVFIAMQKQSFGLVLRFLSYKNSKCVPFIVFTLYIGGVNRHHPLLLYKNESKLLLFRNQESLVTFLTKLLLSYHKAFKIRF